MAPLSGGRPFGGPARPAAAPRPAPLGPGLHLYPGMRVGLLGGSFNPAHPGHAHVAETALMRLGLDRVIWLVSPQNPLKAARETAPLADRAAGARRLARGPRMLVSTLESRIGARYTVDTLRALKARHPGVKFVWIMGADSLSGFHRWRGWREIFRLVPIAVISRPGAAMKSHASPAARRFAAAERPSSWATLLPDAPPPAWIYLRAPLNAASSTAIRAATLRTGAGAGEVTDRAPHGKVDVAIGK